MTDTLRTPAETSPSPVFDEASAQVVDALIVGAGPVGMFAAFQLGLQGVQAHLCDSLPQMGGQCIALYADKPIYDIPGIALCTGRELAAKLQGQILPFHPVFHGQSQVAQMLPHGDGRWRVQLQAIDGAPAQWLLSRIVLITAGVGAFVPKQLRLEGLEAWLGSQVFYHPVLGDAWLDQVLAEQAAPRIVVNGGDESAVEAVIAAAAHPALQAASLVLMHRRDQFNAPEAMLQNLAQLRASRRVQVVIGMPQTINANSRLQGLAYVDAEGKDQHLACDQLWIYQGLSPKLGPLLDWNLALEKKQLQVATDTFQTSAAGIYAAGDIVSYPGKRKLILTGFYEATMAAMAAIEYLRGEKLLLEYTTTSKRLHARLGVSHPD